MAVTMDGEGGAQLSFEDDGGVTVDFEPKPDGAHGLEHNANLAEVLDEVDLVSLGSELVAKFEADERSREDWRKTYIEGLDLLGLKFEDRTKPWNGACGVFHPLLAESVVRFQAQSIQEIFPASGPAKGKVIGNMSPERVKQQHRVVDYLNYLATEEMSEYRSETEMLLFSLPLAGSAFRKVYYDPSLGRATAMFVPVEDFVVSYGASDLATCERATHIMMKTANEVRKLQVAGFYRDVDIPVTKMQARDIKRKYDKISGSEETPNLDDRHMLLEMVVDFDLPGFESPDGVALPYIITIDHSSQLVLSIRRNWLEGDAKRSRRTHFVQYKYLPGLGFYGFGLVHIIGGLAKSATSILRQLVDAGTLANLSAGFKTRGLRIKGDDTPLMPGEFRDVDVPSGSIRDNFAFLPVKEPSTVLYQLLGDLVDEGRRFASAADVKASDMNAEAPVGTTLAILEREMKVVSAVQARIHASMGKELVLLAGIVRDFGPDEYPYEVEGEFSPKADFDGRVDVIPVSDPNAGTMAQRIMQYQAALQLAATAPQIYDIPYLHRQMLEVLNIEGAEQIVPTDDDLRPKDPISENMALLRGEPVKAFLYQDHEAHIQVHMSMAQNPQIAKLMESNPQAQSVMAAGAAHLTEHIAFAYRRKIEEELGFELPGEDEPLPDDIELRLSRLVAPAAAQLTGKAQQQAQAEENARQSEDPIIQMQQKELELKEQELQRKTKESADQLQADLQMNSEKMELERSKLAAKREADIAQISAKLMEAHSRAVGDRAKTEAKERLEGFKLGISIVQDEMNRLEQGSD
jgi:hypothetical protein